jgi:cytoskeletal protein RodZ
MIEFGKTLRTAREAKGITVSQIAEKTHMLVQIVEGLENENFEKIAAPIYGRGFVKLYCEAVGLNPKPMIEEFMEV